MPPSTRIPALLTTAVIVMCGLAGCARPAPNASASQRSGKAVESPPSGSTATAPQDLPSGAAEIASTVTPSSHGSWEIQATGVQDNLHAVAFINDQIGIAVGADQCVLKTADGGNTWKRVAEPKKGIALSHVLFSTPRLGWAASTDGDILHTADGGDSWKMVPSFDSTIGARLYTYAAVESTLFQLGWGLNASRLFQTSDVGKTCTQLADLLPISGYGPTARLVFTDLKRGHFVTGYRGGTLGRTEDGGKTWLTQKTVDEVGQGQEDGPRLCFVDRNHGWYSLPHGSVYATADGGQTWTKRDPGQRNSSIADLHFTDTQLGQVLLDALVRRTTDGGKNWTDLEVLKTPDPGPGNGRFGYVHAVTFISADRGWVVGDKGYIGHYRGKK